MNNLSLRQLRYFDALARHEHFGRAAAASAISQPALSMQIRELEEALGAVLIERTSRSVRLTEFGQEVAVRIRSILRAVDELGEFARTAGGRLAGRLRMGMIPTVAPYLLPAVISALTEAHPGLDVHIREATTAKLIDDLTDGRMDTAVLALPVDEPSLTGVPLIEERFLLVRPRADAGKPIPSREALSEMRLLLLEEGHCFRDQALSFCSITTGKPREVLDASSLSTLVQMVAAGMGVTLVPEMAIRIETKSAPVAVSRFGAPEPSRIIGMVWRRTSPLSRQLMEMAETVRAATQSARLDTPGEDQPGL